MKIFFNGRGDTEVGIHPVEGFFDINFDSIDFSKLERDQIKRDLVKFLEEHFEDMIVCVYFDDECCECYSRLHDNNCINKKCVLNQKKENVK